MMKFIKLGTDTIYKEINPNLKKMKLVGMINRREVPEDSEEWRTLMSMVTEDHLPIPAGASPAIATRLQNRQWELQASYRKWLQGVSESELSHKSEKLWQNQAKLRESRRREKVAEDERQKFIDKHRLKKLPGLNRLMAEAQDAGDEKVVRIVKQMISDYENNAKDRVQYSPARRKAFLSAERQRLAALTLDELLEVDIDDACIAKIVAGLVSLKCTTVRQISDELSIPKSTVRAYLADVSPCFIHRYIGHERNVTAYYYRREVIESVLSRRRSRSNIVQSQSEFSFILPKLLLGL